MKPFVEDRLCAMFPELGRRAVRAMLYAVPFGELVKGGDEAAVGRCVRWVEQAHDSQLTNQRNVGRGTLAAIRCSIPRRPDSSLVCEHCGGTGRVSRGRLVVA